MCDGVSLAKIVNDFSKAVAIFAKKYCRCKQVIF